MLKLLEQALQNKRWELRFIPTCVLTGKPEMREVGQRTQPLGIRLTLLEPIADLLDHLIKRVQSQMWQLLFAQFLAIDVPLGSVLDCLLKRAEPAGARAGESPAASGGLTRMGLRSASMPPCRESVDCGTIICGHRARRIMRTYPAVSQGRNWTREARPDAVNTDGTLIEDSHPATLRAVAAA
jgi:hypothetical protein